jgi:hypothetical protein
MHVAQYTNIGDGYSMVVNVQQLQLSYKLPVGLQIYPKQFLARHATILATLYCEPSSSREARPELPRSTQLLACTMCFSMLVALQTDEAILQWCKPRVYT